MLGAERTLDRNRRFHLEEVPPHDINVAAVLLLDLVQQCGRRIKLYGKVAARSMDQTVFADFVRQSARAEVLQLADDAAVVEDLFGGAFERGHQFGLGGMNKCIVGIEIWGLWCGLCWIYLVGDCIYPRHLSQHQRQFVGGHRVKGAAES